MGARPARSALVPGKAARAEAGGMWGEGPGGRAVPLGGTVGAEQAPGLQQNQGVSRAEVPKASQRDCSTEQRSPGLGDGRWWGPWGTEGALHWVACGGPTSTTGCLSALTLPGLSFLNHKMEAAQHSEQGRGVTSSR